MANFFDQFDAAPAPAAVPARSGNFFDQYDNAPSFDDRFRGEQSTAAPNPELKAGLQQVARAKTTGPRLGGIESMAVDYLNQLPSAAQGTTPSVDTHYQNIVSADVLESDSGQLLYRDAAGQTFPVDTNKHVTLRDPADGRVKIFRRTEDTDEGMAVGLGRALIAGSGAGAPTARASVGAPAKAAIGTPRASEIMATAKPSYQAFKTEAGAIDLPAETAIGVADRLRTSLDKINLTEEMAGPAARSAISLLEGGKITTLADLQKVKRMAGRGFQAAEKDARDAAGALSSEISRVIAEVSPSASQSLRTGDAIHSTALSVQDLQRKGAVADLRTGRAGYGGNAVNSIRQVLSPVVQRSVEGKSTLYKPNEIAAMREIVDGTTATNAARSVGQLSPSKGIIQTGAALGGAATIGPAALVFPALGIAANKVATVLTGNQIQRLQELVAKRSPAYAEAVAKAAQRYERAQSEFASNPSSAKLAAYVQASRLLSNGLTRDGIQITSGDLIRSIQGPMRSAAEDENPEAPGGLNQ